MEKELKEWLAEKVLRNPEFVKLKIFPSLEILEDRKHLELHNANRVGTIEQIKYQQGRYDGVQDVIALLKGLQMSETKKPGSGGLMQSILGFGRT